MTWIHSTDKHLLFTKNDQEDPRLGDCVQILDKTQIENTASITYDFAIIGFPDDEGIALNGGRPGAQMAPKEIRSVLYKMTPHLKTKSLPKILDIGDLTNREKSLSDRHQKARETIKTIAQNNKPWISFGGGHDYGYCDASAFLDLHAGNAVLINFDAHMDVRPTDKGFNSGTPFFRVLSEFENKVDFAEVGIQNQCNSRSHIEWAKKMGTTVFTLDHITEHGLKNSLETFLNDKKNKKIFLSIDIDAFTSNEAPGCSQSWTTGLTAKDFLPCLQWLVENFEVCGMGIYEVSPVLDHDKRTSKLAALIAHQFIFSSLNKGQ